MHGRQIQRDSDRRLARLLNVAMFLTPNYCVVPPGFVADDPVVLALLEAMEPYRVARLIRFPMRESLDDYWGKRERWYRDVHDDESERRAQEFLEQNKRLIIDRPGPTITGMLVSEWAEAPDQNRLFRLECGDLPTPVQELIRNLPRRLQDEGEPVTWDAMARRHPELKKAGGRVRMVNQSIYFGTQLRLLNLVLLSRLPLAGMPSYDLTSDRYYDYEAVTTILRSADAMEDILGASPVDIVRMREIDEYFPAIRGIWDLTSKTRTGLELREALGTLPKLELDPEYESLILPVSSLPRADSNLGEILDRVSTVCTNAMTRLQDTEEERTRRLGVAAGPLDDARRSLAGEEKWPLIR